ncbi:MAG: ABC transporter ATP-binding protein [Spirochaetaceae bacterium]|nr:ABC transporter ATP-binding protein [Spirochaetaceae bacterium]
MIKVSGVSRSYGDHVAVSEASFTIAKGEIVGFLGPNGAGKSTLMNIITGYIRPHEGVVNVEGIDVVKNPLEAKQKIGYLPEQPPLYLDMTISEQLLLQSSLRGIPREKKKTAIETVLAATRIEDVKNRVIRNLSKGYRQRVGLAQAILGDPKILVLDEPMVGLDPIQVTEIRNVILSMGKDHTVILSSHVLSEISALCKRAIIINKSKIVADGSIGALGRSMEKGSKIVARICGPKEDVIRLISSIPGVLRCECTGESEPGSLDFLIDTDPNTDIRKDLFYQLSSCSYPLILLKPQDIIGLEEIFLEFTGAPAQNINTLVGS